MVVDVIAALRRVGQRSVSGGRESQKCVIVNDSVAQLEWYVSHRRGLRIWGLSPNAGPRPSPYQVLPSGRLRTCFVLSPSVWTTYYHTKFYLRQNADVDVFSLFPPNCSCIELVAPGSNFGW